jgi:hypothetical protein
MASTRTPTLTAEELDDRTLPSATVHALTTAGAEHVTEGFIARQVAAQPTGTGFIHSFVRVQGAASGGGIEQGYNTTARPLQFDENKSPQFTRGLTLDQVPRVMENGVAYREFLLDINQKSSSPRLSLDQVRVFLGDRSDLTGYDATAWTLDSRPVVFDLDANGDVSLVLDARLNSGSGAGDMVLLIPDANFAGAEPNAFVYLFSRMGGVAGATANGGFEEWAVRKTGGQPAAGTSSLSGSVFVDRNFNGTHDPGEGLAGVTIQLQGVDDLGNTVVLLAITDANGAYSFTGLRAGTYSLLEVQPDDSQLLDGQDFVGTINGQTVGSVANDGFGNDRLYDIFLGPDEDGINYNFSEFQAE